MLFEGLPDASLAVREAFATGIQPPPERGVSAWADAERILGPEEGPYPGLWRTDRAPYLREPMDCMGLTHPARRVTLMASAQVGKTMAELNMAGQVAAETPTTILWVLPSLEEARQFNREKLEPLIANTPAVGRKVKALVSRDETGSTTMLKRFPGGSLELTGASSSKGLQMRTKRVVILDEVSEFPADVDGRGDPVAMAEARTTAWTGREKIIAVSTPGTKGSCRISARYEEGSGGRFLLACPHCGHRQALTIDNLHWPQDEPERAQYHCEGCGTGIDHRAKADMLAAGAWEHTRPELIVVHASFALNALYSPFVDWAWIARRRDESRDDPLKDKVFTQQVLGLPYEARYDLPNHELLWRRREPWPPRRIPPGVLFLTGAADVQGDRIEWAVYGWGRDLSQWWIDGGILEGDPQLDPVWLALDEVAFRTWPDAWGTPRACFSFGVDTGYLPQRGYAWSRRHAGRSEPLCMALDGRPKWGEPPIGTPKPQDVDFQGRKIGSVMLWPVGTWDLKTELAGALRLTEMGPDAAGQWPKGAMRFPQALDMGFFEQLTAEACVEVQGKSGFSRREWRKVKTRNEQWDLAVYTRALARHATLGFDESRWAALEAERQGAAEAMQGDLAQHWGAALVPSPPPPRPAPPAPAARPALQEDGIFAGAEHYWQE
jgi:phage terminase large subunit GpA-like protein